MSQHDLTSVEARAVIRRYAHDLRNMINCMDLEIACLLEEPAAAGAEAALRQIREQLLLTERTVFSLSVRFREPSLHPAAAADMFYNWRQQLHKLGQGARFQWEETACAAAITVDFTAMIAVLVEICLHIKSPAEAPPPMAALRTEGDRAIFSVHEAAVENRFPMDAQQWQEWERLAAISGGRLEATGDEEDSGPRVTRLVFPCTPSTPQF
jgi:hypothetical protein